MWIMKAPGNTARVSMGLSFMGGKWAYHTENGLATSTLRQFKTSQRFQPRSSIQGLRRHTCRNSLPVPLNPHPLYSALCLVSSKTKDHDSNTIDVWSRYKQTIFCLKSCYVWWRLTKVVCVASFVQLRQLHTKQHNPTCDLVAYVITRSIHSISSVCQTPYILTFFNFIHNTAQQSDFIRS